MKRFLITALLVIVCFILQTTIFKGIAFGGIVPNLLIVLTASFGFMRGEKTGILVGFFCGLLADIFFGEVLGFNAMIYMYVGYLNGKFSPVFYPEDIKLPLALIVTSDLSYGIICYVLSFMLRGRLEFSYYFTHVILPEALYTILVTMFLYPLILKVNEKLEIREKRSAQKFV